MISNRFLFLPVLLCLAFLASPQAHAQAAPVQEQVVQGAQNVNIFTGKDAAASIAEALSKAGLGNDLKVSINEVQDATVLVTSSNIISVQTDNLEVDREHNRWQALMLLKADGRNLAPAKFTGRYDELVAVPVLKRRVGPGETIAQEDIDWGHEPSAYIRKTVVTDAHMLIGKSPKHLITQGRPVRLDEVANPVVLPRGGRVTLVYKTRNLEIKTFGEALDNGAKGDVIRVRNITSKAIVQGIVEAPDRVRVASPDDSDSAEAM